MTSGPRRFPPPWDKKEHDRICFIVRDDNGQALAYVYFETEPADAQLPVCSRVMNRVAFSTKWPPNGLD